MVFDLDELDNTNNLKNGPHSNTLLTYHVTAYDDSTHFDPYVHQYKKPKNGEFVLIIKHMKKKFPSQQKVSLISYMLKE